MLRRSLVVAAVTLLAGCLHKLSPRPMVKLLAPSVVVSSTPWWSAGDAACPTLTGAPPPWAPPGAGDRVGRLLGTQGVKLYCEAGGVAHGPATSFHPNGQRGPAA